MPSILTIPRAARLLGIDRKTLWRWVSSKPEWAACVVSRSGTRAYLSTEMLRARRALGGAA